MNNSPIGAVNDGCLQIQVPDPRNRDGIFWSRQYYVVPLEVLSLSLLFRLAVFQADCVIGETVLSRGWEG